MQSLRAGMATQERSLVAAQFNDPEYSMDALVVTYAMCSLGLNLHHTCNHVALMEPAVNANTVLQAIGRVHRLGQQRRQQVWILSSPHTFDHFVEGNQCRKMVAQIIGVGYEYFSQFDHGRTGGSADNEDEDEDGSEPQQNSELVKRACQLFNEMFGLGYSRYEYDDATEMGLSDAQKKRVERLAKQIPLQFASSRQIFPWPPIRRSVPPRMRQKARAATRFCLSVTSGE